MINSEANTRTPTTPPPPPHHSPFCYLYVTHSVYCVESGLLCWWITELCFVSCEAPGIVDHHYKGSSDLQLYSGCRHTSCYMYRILPVTLHGLIIANKI